MELLKQLYYIHSPFYREWPMICFICEYIREHVPAAIFEDLFKLYNKSKRSLTFVIPREDKKVQLKEGGRNARFKVIEIHYKKHTQKALIAHTFPSRGLNWAFDLMQKYGKACYDEFIKNQ